MCLNIIYFTVGSLDETMMNLCLYNNPTRPSSVEDKNEWIPSSIPLMIS